jgi:hypothetical protein
MAIFVRNHCPLGVILSLQVTGVISPWSSKHCAAPSLKCLPCQITHTAPGESLRTLFVWFLSHVRRAAFAASEMNSTSRGRDISEGTPNRDKGYRQD